MSPDGQSAVISERIPLVFDSGSRSALKIWNVQTGEKLFTIAGHKFDVDGLIFTRDDRFLLTGSVDATIKFWDMKTGQLSRTISMTK